MSGLIIYELLPEELRDDVRNMILTITCEHLNRGKTSQVISKHVSDYIVQFEIKLSEPAYISDDGFICKEFIVTVKMSSKSVGSGEHRFVITFRDVNTMSAAPADEELETLAGLGVLTKIHPMGYFYEEYQAPRVAKIPLLVSEYIYLNYLTEVFANGEYRK